MKTSQNANHGRDRYQLPRPIEILYSCLWMALAVGLADSAYWRLKSWREGFIFRSESVYWMAPVAELILFSTLCALLLLLRLCRPKWVTMRLVSLVLTFFAVWELLLLVPRIHLHTYAYVLLAAGSAVQLSRLAQAYQRWLLVLVSSSWFWLGGLVVVMGIAIEAGPSVFKQHGSAAGTAVVRQDAPNVLLIVLDTVRADALNLNAHGRQTSAELSRLAKRGVVFERAFSTSPWTLPSHASMFTGRWPHQLSTDWFAPLDGTDTTLAELLQQHGYRTAGFVANTMYCSSETGLARGFVHYEDFEISWASLFKSTRLGMKLRKNGFLDGPGFFDLSGRKSAEDINADFLAWLSQQQRPYFAFLNYFDAHDPYLLPKPNRNPHQRTSKQYQLLKRWWITKKESLTAADIKFARTAYEDCIAYLDRQLGRLFEELERRGELQNSLVIITADHGEHFGEHDLFGHGNSLYQPVVHVPLMILRPTQVPAGERIDDAVSLRDLPATILDLIDLESTFPGRSLRHYWTHSPEKNLVSDPTVLTEISTPPEHPPSDGHSPVCRGPMKSIMLAGFKYIRNGDLQEELYDLNLDPSEQTNLAENNAAVEMLERCRKALHEIGTKTLVDTTRAR